MLLYFISLGSFTLLAKCPKVLNHFTPDLFIEKVTSPPTVQLLELFRANDYNSALEYMISLGTPRDLAHGAWSDFKVLLGSWDSIVFEHSPVVYIHHSEGDENAPIDSIRDLAERLPQSEIRISSYASHVGLAEDKEFVEFTRIFKEIGTLSGTASQ
ncbi:hypothetical protein ACJJIF_02175 [Microbulbifer sp. SSSA002]